VTSNGWLNLFLQVGQQEDIEEPEHGFMFSQYSSNAYVQISQVNIDSDNLHRYSQSALDFVFR
jgi:hypothetical protein